MQQVLVLRLISIEEITKMKLNMYQHKKHSKCSRESWGSEVGAAVRPTTDIALLTINVGLQVEASEDSKDLLNSWEI